MDSIGKHNIPYDLEDSLIEAMEKILRGRRPNESSFEAILYLICDIVNLEEEFRLAVFNPRYLQRLKRVWSNRCAVNDTFRRQAIFTENNLPRTRNSVMSDSVLSLGESSLSGDPFQLEESVARQQNYDSLDDVQISISASSTKCTKPIIEKSPKFSKAVAFDKVKEGQIDLQSICLSCGDFNIVAKHPLFLGGLCAEHKILFHENFFKYDSDGCHSCCSVCCTGKKVLLCDVPDCGRCYCQTCVNSATEKNYFQEAVSSKRWICFFCQPRNKSLLRRREEWQEEIQALFQNIDDSKYPGLYVPKPTLISSRRPIRVLSLFDGIATGMVALKQLGLDIGSFVASEIDEDAIRLVQNRHPEVVHIGDITKLSDEYIYELGPFDLLLGGSPCNDLSGANPRRKGLIDAEGSGCLFFDFYRVLKTIEPPRGANGRYRDRPFFWLFENVVSMKGIEKQRISRFLQCEPRMADARYVSAAARPRLFWGNIPGLRNRKIGPAANDRLKVQNCLEPGRKATVEKLNTITTKFTCLYQGQSRQAPVVHHGKEDILWTTEVEKIFGVPEHYTDVNNLGPRERLALLGRSWSVPVVKIILAPLKEYFANLQPESMDGVILWRN